MKENLRFRSLDMIVTAGSSYLDIDAYACMVAMAELLRKQGKNAVAYSRAVRNYSICDSLLVPGQILEKLPMDIVPKTTEYVIVDVSDPSFIGDFVPLEQVTAVYDHHAGFEEYWYSCIGNDAHIEFIGAAATLIYRQWNQAGVEQEMEQSTACLLIAAILDNTMYLNSSNTTDEDRQAFEALCRYAHVDERWCAAYFEQVQETVEEDLKNALVYDLKKIGKNDILPPCVAQLCVWNGEKILKKLPQIRQWFAEASWMLNVIDIHGNCSYFVCDDKHYQKKLEKLFGVRFCSGVAKTQKPYLRKEIIKKTLEKKDK